MFHVSEPELYSSERVTLRHQGRDRTFTVVTPDQVPEHPRALFYFHGSLQSGNVARNFTGRTFDDMAARTGTILIYPDGVDRHFNDTRRHLRENTRQLGIDDVEFTKAIIEWTAEHRSVDTGQVFAAGYSNGGQMVLRLLHDAPGLLNGAATFAAPMPAADNIADYIGEADTPTAYLAMHGTGDEIVPYEGGEAGFHESRSRGLIVSALESAEYFAAINGLDKSDHSRTERGDSVVVDSWSRPGHPSVQLWSIIGMGHLVPTPKQLPPSIGPGTDAIIGADVLAQFFGWV